MSVADAANIIFYEGLGTFVFVLLINGVCISSGLRTARSHTNEWLFLGIGAGVAVSTACFVAYESGANLNPVVTVANALLSNIPWIQVPFYIIGQMLGAMLAPLVAFLVFKQEFDKDYEYNNSTQILFFTVPEDRSLLWNTVSEAVGSFLLLLYVVFALDTSSDLGTLKYMGVGVVVASIGLAVGAPTCYAINPARDLGPRLMYQFILPIKNKGKVDWQYAIVPILGPFIGGLVVVLLKLFVDHVIV